jgi:hypothetical protein
LKASRPELLGQSKGNLWPWKQDREDHGSGTTIYGNSSNLRDSGTNNNEPGINLDFTESVIMLPGEY